MGTETFETQVLVSLAEIKGDINLIKSQGEDSSKRLDSHWGEIDNLKNEISHLKSGQARIIAIAATLAVVLPIVISILSNFAEVP